ncbi:MAG TPA: PAS domain S-box protein [Methylomirabilota bacterium]|nr:PAS domain S-box protein [Methylomirabilota bacterium]
MTALHFLRNVPIQRKLSLVIMAACALILVLACTALFVFESHMLKKTFARDLATLAEVVAATCTGPMAFHDKKAAEEMLGALKGRPQITAAFISSPDQKMFARLAAGEKFHSVEVFPRQQGSHYEGNDLFLSQPIMSDGEVLGVLRVRANVQTMHHDLLKLYAGMLSVVLAGSLLLSFLLSMRLQKIISVPILQLAGTARSIAQHKDYSVRAISLGRDEVGLLTDDFNLMLAQIQTQDDALQGARQELEQQNSALHASESKYRSVVNNVKEVVFQTDAAGRWILLNPAWVEITGFSIEESLNQNLRDFVHADDRAADQEEIQMLLQRREESFRHEVRYLTKGGGFRWVEVYARLATGTDGAVLGITGMLHDITERKLAQAELETLNRQLIATSRQAGMAEVATSVLHNVGNVLNSVNVSTTLVAEQVKKSKVANLAKAAALLNEHAADFGAFITTDPKGKQLPDYLAQLARHLQAEQVTLLNEMDQLRKNIEHIKDIVAMQQSYARVSGVTETLKISDLVEDALRMNAGALTRHDVEVVREFEEIPLVTIDKHKVLQVLVNLIRNAKYACDESGRADKRMTVRVANGEGRLKIAIMDNGVGIPMENLIRIFNHGFTTRQEGHGFGLHSGALAAKELGGALIVHSEGPGCGASFTLELPLDPASGNAGQPAPKSAEAQGTKNL